MFIVRLLSSKIALYISILIIVCVTAYLTFWCGITSALCVYVVFLVVGIVGEMKKKYLMHYAPLITYILLVLEAAVNFSLEEEVLRQDEAKILSDVTIYGSIMLLTIPILYFNRSLK